jgi:predicted nucleotidyltransferase
MCWIVAIVYDADLRESYATARPMHNPPPIDPGGPPSVPPPDHQVFPEARQVLDRLLAGLDQRSPGLIAGVHLIGSIALGDGRPGQSDIDLVLVRAEDFDDATTMAALEPVLADLRRDHLRPALDGIVLDAADLAAGPDATAGDRPVVFENEARLGSGGSARNPVTWATLRQCGIACRGVLDRDRLWHDPVRLDAWTRENLASYWQPWLTRTDHLASRFGIASLGGWATEWGVLGVTRLHATLSTGQIVSKRGAGDYALDRFSPEWHPIVEEAIRIRERRPGGRYRSRLHRRRELRVYMAMVIDDALMLPRMHGFVGT